MVRYPAVAGQFYPGTQSELLSFLNSLCRESSSKVRAKAVVVPHAGYIYSGGVAGETYGKVEIPENNVIMGPNHTGLGKPAAVFPQGTWITPLGEVEINEAFTSELLNLYPFEADSTAHVYEHSLEVQVPFLQFCSQNENLKIVPIVFQHLPLEDCIRAGENLAKVISSLEEDTLIVISTDFSHYVLQETAEYLDSIAIEAILNLSPEELYVKVLEYNISMCGFIPATVGLTAAKELGAKNAELVAYRTSGDVTGDYSQVVGYAGIIIY